VLNVVLFNIQVRPYQDCDDIWIYPYPPVFDGGYSHLSTLGLTSQWFV